MELGRRAIRGKDVRITSCHPENGAVVVGCANTHTKSWLETQFKQLGPFEGIQLRLYGPSPKLGANVQGHNLRTSHHWGGDDIILGLKSQSRLDTDHWAVVGGNTTPEGQLLVIHVDEASLQKLRSRGMRAFLRAEHVLFKLQGEPWTVKGRVMGMSTAKGKLIYDTQCDKPRACVFVNKNIKALKITDLCSRDTAVTEVHLQTGDGSIRILFASMYLPYDSVEAP
nr:unnamed protein product [Callosobruchus chinensis]